MSPSRNQLWLDLNPRPWADESSVVPLSIVKICSSYTIFMFIILIILLITLLIILIMNLIITLMIILTTLLIILKIYL